MESGSFGALAMVTSLGLLADRVVLALETIHRTPPAEVPEDSRALFGEAATFLDLALHKSRRQLTRQVTGKAVRSEQAYHQAIRAARATREAGAPPAVADEKELSQFLSEMKGTLKRMQRGIVEDKSKRRQVMDFFLALSDTTTAEHNRMSLQSVVHWRGDK